MAKNQQAATPKSQVLTTGDKALIFLSFIPIVNSIALFHMNNRTLNKKWKRNAWIFLFMNIVFFITFFITDFAAEVNYVNVPDEPIGKPDSTLVVAPDVPTYGNEPNVYDYIPEAEAGDILNGKFKDDSRYAEYKAAHDKWEEEEEAYKKSDQYKKDYAEYEKEYKEYEKKQAEYDKAVAEYESTSEYKAYKEADDKNDRIQSIVAGISAGLFMAWVIVNPVAFCYVVSQKRKYEYLLRQDGKKDAAMSRLAGNGFAQQAAPQTFTQPQPQQAPPANYGQPQGYAQPQPQQQMNFTQPAPQQQYQQPPVQQAAPQGALDINSATEDEIAALPGLTIIDARRAVAYRNENGGFANTDAFFEAISAKPHIMVKIQPMITASAPQPKPTNEPSGSGRRMIDL
ncbi:MAG: helix-hairpin-helix domain-containing protein [Eubacterium sp.]|nr:helix-hairpin-helix domain-containing protein [Eubacterium sp.]